MSLILPAICVFLGLVAGTALAGLMGHVMLVRMERALKEAKARPGASQAEPIASHIGTGDGPALSDRLPVPREQWQSPLAIHMAASLRKPLVVVDKAYYIVEMDADGRWVQLVRDEMSRQTAAVPPDGLGQVAKRNFARAPYMGPEALVFPTDEDGV